jgi:AbrB family looped-hinge helix DNA binding protein
MDVITMSSKGQLVIPRQIREEMGIKERDKFIVIYEQDAILLKKVRQEEMKEKMMDMLNEFAKDFRKARISRKDIEREIKDARKEKGRG